MSMSWRKTTCGKIAAKLFWRCHREDDGGAYSISLLIVLPTLVTLIAVLVAANGLMVSRLGLSHAVFAAARCVVVWAPIDLRKESLLRDSPLLDVARSTPDFVNSIEIDNDSSGLELQTLHRRCHLAVAKALAPFASGQAQHNPFDSANVPPSWLSAAATDFATWRRGN